VTLTVGSLFSGAAGLDMAVESVLDARTAWHAEIDPAACRVLAHRYPDVPNLGDVTSIDWAAVPPVDVVTAGYPCQPFSDAGQRKGEDDARYLWPEVARCIREVGPRLVILENVRGHLVRGFSRVVGELSELGYDAQWTTVRASDVGAPHRRERLFCVAWPATDASGGQLSRAAAAGNGLLVLAERRHRVAPDTLSGGRDGWPRSSSFRSPERDEGRPEPARLVGRPDAPERGAVAADADSDALRIEPVAEPRRSSEAKPRLAIQWGQYAPAVARWEHVIGRPAPAPTELAPRGGQRLSPRFVEWMMGWPDGWVTEVPGVSRNDALKICGNGVVPAQAAEALRRMLTEQAQAA
jgi:DNA (cytosine-5)-methyltransferase 1